jgi:hypothetical protein
VTALSGLAVEGVWICGVQGLNKTRLGDCRASGFFGAGSAVLDHAVDGAGVVQVSVGFDLDGVAVVDPEVGRRGWGSRTDVGLPGG